ncbi:MAG: FecR domain-containing protein [Sediminispirochaetaceae bacterium]
MKKLRCLLCPVLFLVLTVSLHAQTQAAETPAGSLVYATGSGFQLIRDGSSRDYDLTVDSADGLEFFPGDYINTYEATFIEIELTGSGHLLKISENTSFLFEEKQQSEQNRFVVNYGRVRARVEKLAGLEQFTIDGPSMVAGVRGTDFGYDVLYTSGSGTPVSSVYCFTGEIEVRPKVAISSAEGLEKEIEQELLEQGGTAVIIKADEMMKLESDTEGTGELFRIRKIPVSEEINTFWEKNDFVAGTPITVTPPVIEEEEPQETPVRFTMSQMRKGSLLLGGIGTVFGAAAATFYYADPLFEDMNQNTRDNLTLSMGIAGGLFLSTSLVLFFGSLVSD